MNDGLANSGQSANRTIHLDGSGSPFFPCRCGETHSGTYGQEDWLHHNCFHGPFTPLDDAAAGQVLCIQCGAVFEVVA